MKRFNTLNEGESTEGGVSRVTKNIHELLQGNPARIDEEGNIIPSDPHELLEVLPDLAHESNAVAYERKKQVVNKILKLRHVKKDDMTLA